MGERHAHPDHAVWKSLDAWREFLSFRYPGAEVVASGPSRAFRARYRAWNLGSLEFAEIGCSSSQCLQVTAPKQVALDSYYLPLQLEGIAHCGQDGHGCRATARSMLLLDSRIPHYRELGAESRMLNVRLPKPLLERYLPDAGAVCVRPVSGDSGQGAVAWALLNSLWTQRTTLDAAGLPALADVVARMVASLFGPLRRKDPDPPGAVSRHRRRLLEYIADNLDDPQLDVQGTADACGISYRYVHLLMRDTGRTFSQYLLEHRLECCRSVLEARHDSARSITEIAFECGFNDASHFSRAFRGRYGLSPREFRRARASGADPAFDVGSGGAPRGPAARSMR